MWDETARFGIPQPEATDDPRPNRVVILVEGINYAEGTYDELYRSKDPKVQAFFK